MSKLADGIRVGLLLLSGAACSQQHAEPPPHENPLASQGLPSASKQLLIRLGLDGVPILETCKLSSAQGCVPFLFTDEALQQAASPTVHTVQEGDTYGKLAVRYLEDERRWPEIMALTKARYGRELKPNALKIGMELDIPAKVDLATHYRCEQGETVQEVAAKCYGSARYWYLIPLMNPDLPIKNFQLSQSTELRVRPERNTALLCSAMDLERLFDREIPTPRPTKLKVLDPAVREFIETFAPLAVKIEKEYGIPATLTLAQSGAECGWNLKPDGNCYFGVKLDGAFVSYDSPEQAFQGYALRLCTARYLSFWRETEDPQRCIELITEAGWTTDEGYVESVQAAIGNLTITAEIDPYPDKPGYHKVEIRDGDSFGELARERLGHAKYASLIEAANPNLNPNRLRIGQTVYIPDAVPAKR